MMCWIKRTAITAAAVTLAFFLGITAIISMMQEMFLAVAGEEKNRRNGTQISDEHMAGLPEWITVEMVTAAVEQMQETGYPASVLLGQMIDESGAGGSELSNPPYYNCLGQKSPSYLETGTVTFATMEAWGEETAAFSTFASYLDCMRAWGHKFTMAPYLNNVLACPKDPVTGYYEADSFIYAVWISGYATDENYVSKVITIMTEYDLYKFNSMTADEVQDSYVDGYDGTVTPLMEKIADIAKNNQGLYGTVKNMCAAWVTGVYQAAGAPVVPWGDAIDMWNTYQFTGSTSMDNIPPGAIVCGSGSGDEGALYGHVGIYIGDGLVANNKGSFEIETLEQWCGWQNAMCQGHVGWIGWVFPGGVPQE